MLRNRVINWLLKNSTHLVDPRDVFAITDKGEIFIGGGRVPLEALKQLKSEVSALKEFSIWKIIQQTVREKAIETAIKNSTNYEHVLAGKTLLLSLDYINQIVELIDRQKL